MQAIDPCACLDQVALNLGRLTVREQVQTVLDEVGYLLEVIPPELLIRL